MAESQKSVARGVSDALFKSELESGTPFDGSYPTVLLSWITSWECDTPCAHQSLEVLTTNCIMLNKIQQTK